jgi:SAM-dependent methyltransferase
MFVEESVWIRGGLEKADLREGMTLLDVGSSTERFRRLHQPFIDYEIFLPLRRRGVRIVHVDARRDEGVDVVCNLADPATEPEAAGLEPAHAVLAANLLEHVLDRDLVLTRIKRLTRPGGIIVVTVPNLMGSTKTRSIRCIAPPTASWKLSSRRTTSKSSNRASSRSRRRKPFLLLPLFPRLVNGICRGLGRRQPFEVRIVRNKISAVIVRKKAC